MLFAKGAIAEPFGVQRGQQRVGGIAGARQRRVAVERAIKGDAHSPPVMGLFTDHPDRHFAAVERFDDGRVTKARHLPGGGDELADGPLGAD